MSGIENIRPAPMEFSSDNRANDARDIVITALKSEVARLSMAVVSLEARIDDINARLKRIC